MVTFATVVTRESVSQARVLAATLHACVPDAEVVACVLSGYAQLRPPEPFELLRIEELEGGPDDHGPRVLGSPELAPARLLERLLERGVETAVYLDAHTAVHAGLDPVVNAAREHGVALCRRVNRLPEDGERPSLADLIVGGQVSPNCVAASGELGRRFARWWAHGISQAGAPARWLELAPTVFPGIAWVEDPGVGVSFWNLHERPLERREAIVLAGGAPLRLLDFSGFRADRPYLLSEAATRVRPLEDDVLAELCGTYARQLRDSGWSPPELEVGPEQRFGNGLPMNPLLRRCWAEAQAGGRGFEDPASPLAAEAFAAWLREPAPAGGSAGVNRYLHAVYLQRPDLQAAFEDLDTEADGLIAWAWEHGRRELELVPELLPPSPEGMGAVDDAHLTVNVLGYLQDTLGIGEAARLYVEALGAAGVPVTTTAVTPDLPVDSARGKVIRRFGRRDHHAPSVPYEPAFNLVCINGDHLTEFVRNGGSEVLADRMTIGHWAWETDIVPASWLSGFDYVEEIWVNSNFVAENLGRLSPVPVVMIPQAIRVPNTRGADPQLIRDGRFTFLFMFDFFSTLQRKNPLGLVDAFKRAFAPGEGPRLLLKTINASFRSEAAAELRAQIEDREDIELIDRFLEPAETAALIARADCYSSLHRSEGFGLTLAESMALGTPVIATAYSGNLDFTTERNSYLVDWRPTRVGAGGDVYPPDGTWAEPDLDHAAELMRRVWQNPSEAAEKAARARLDIERLYAPPVAGAAARRRLEALLEMRRDGPRRQPGGPLSAIERELALDLRRGVPSRRPASALVRRVAMRMMLPFTLHERSLDRAVLDALRELRRDLERERARGARARTRLRRLEERTAREEASP